MNCYKCGDKPKKNCGAFPKAVIEIDNPEKIVLLRKVLVPASMGDESTFPPTIGKYHNVLLEYEASGGIYLYSSDGIPTKLSSDVTELQAQLNALRVRIGEEEVARADADTALSDRITSLDDSLATVARTGSYNDLSNKPTIGNGTLTIKKNGSNVGTFTANATANTDVNIVVPTKTSDLANDGSDGASQYVESNDLATVATSGSYNDLTNKPTIGNATLTIKRNGTNVGTFTANATTNKSINIAVPTKTSDLTNDGADGTSTYVEADDLPIVDTTYSSSSNNAIANSTVTNSLDRNVMTNLAVDSTPSTTTVNLSNTKTNLAYPSSSTTSSISLPVASSTQAGVMNSATFDAVTSNTNNINAILNGAVAISNLPASPTQAQLTTAWENETGLTSLINRASVYDVTNNKVWTYYTNDQTWHAASNTSQVTVNTFTNSSEGTIKGSTNDGQVFAENDGTGSVNGWGALTSAVSSNTSKLATIAQGAEVNVQSDWSQTNTSADDYIKNKPANLVQDANYVHTDNNFTTTLKNKLDGIESGAEVNVQADWSQTDTTADDYIKNKPTIPTVNNATLTIQKNGVNVQTFTANSSTNKTANITVPTAVSELTNDSGYATTTQLNDGLATKQNTLAAGDNIQINGNTISATDTTYTAGNAIDITNGEISADIHPADFFTASDSISDCGSNLSLDNTIASTLRSVELKGDTYQQTYSGKNLFDSPTSAGQTFRASYSQIDANSFTITSTETTNGTAYIQIDKTLQPNQTYTISWDKTVTAGTPTSIAGNLAVQVGASGTIPSPIQSPVTVTTDSSGLLRLYFYLSYAGSGTTTLGDSIKIYNTQLELGSTATDYEPYVGGIPAPNPDYPQDIQVVTGEQTVTVNGKNLYDVLDTSGQSVATEITVDSDGWIHATYNNTSPSTLFLNYRTNPLFLKTNTEYATIMEIKSVSGSGSVVPVNGGTVDQFTNTKSYPFSDLSDNGVYKYTDTTKSSFDGVTRGLSSYIRFGAGQSGSIVFRLSVLADTSVTPATFSYEPYQSQSYEVNLGKNLWGGFPTDVSATSSSVSWVNKADGTITANGTATALSTSMFSGVAVSNNHTITLQAGTYTLSGGVSDTVRVELVDSAGTSLGFAGAAPTTIVLSEKTKVFIRGLVPNGATVSNITLQPQLEQGSTATSYAPYFTPIELCKIGDYQDYIYKSGDDWYVHKAMGRITLDGSETWSATQMTNNWMYYTTNAGMAVVTSSQMPNIISNYFSVATTDGQWVSVAGSKSITLNNAASPNTQIRITVGDNTNKLADFKTWLSTHNTIIYYPLATPTDTKITDATLIGQLNALAGARSYNDQTNIAVTAAGDNLPATLCVEAYRKSLSGVIEAIDNACTCRKNLVVYLPNGMTTYENNDAPIPIPEVLEALERGQSVFLVGGGLSWNVYTVTAANAGDGIWTMRADQTGINSDVSDGHWHISGRDNLWRRVEFIPDTEQDSVINLSVVFDNSSWGTPVADYSVTNAGGGTTTVGHCNLSAAQGNAGLFVNDDTGEFVTIGEAYELIASGAKVKFNNVPVFQYLTSPHTSSPSGEDVYSGIELPVKYFINVDGAYITDYTNSIAQPRNKGVPPLGISIRKIDQGDILDYEFTIQGIMPSFN